MQEHCSLRNTQNITKKMRLF